MMRGLLLSMTIRSSAPSSPLSMIALRRAVTGLESQLLTTATSRPASRSRARISRASETWMVNGFSTTKRRNPAETAATNTG
ncbi:hypothetical protein BE20_18725 [Sorangium cellulosum]|nr:hypothetical protein BE20_18725 [Sorangium cellulosum]